MAGNTSSSAAKANTKAPTQSRLSGRGKKVGGADKSNDHPTQSSKKTKGGASTLDTKAQKELVTESTAPPGKKESTPSKPATPKKPKKLALTPAQLAKLSTGPKAAIVVGPVGNTYIIFEAAFKNVLAHYSGLAKRQLVDEGASRLYVPDGSKPIITWIYKHMLAGEQDAEGEKKLEQLNVQELCRLYGQASALEYKELADKIKGRLEYFLHTAVPGIQSVDAILTRVTELNDAIVAAVGRLYLLPLEMDYTPYTNYCDQHSLFGAKVGRWVDFQRGKRVQAGERYYQSAQPSAGVQRYNKLYEDLASGKPLGRGKGKGADFECYNCGEFGHIARLCPAPKYYAQDDREPPECYNCHKIGHIARNCPHSENKRARSNRWFIEPESNGLGIKTWDREAKEGQVTRTGMII